MRFVDAGGWVVHDAVGHFFDLLDLMLALFKTKQGPFILLMPV